MVWVISPSLDNELNSTVRNSTQYWELTIGSKIAYTHLTPKNDSILGTIIYLHGGPGGYIDDLTINVFENIANNGYEVFLYDQIGSGLSSRLANPKDYSVQRHSNDLKNIITNIDAERTILIGQSWGGFLASYFATYNPNLVSEIILSAPSGIYPPLPNIMETDKDDLIQGLTNIDERTERLNETMENSLTKKETIWLAMASIFGNPSFISDDKVDGVLHKFSKEFVSAMVCDTLRAEEPNGRPGMYSAIFTKKSTDSITKQFRNDMKSFSKPVLVLKPECDYIPWQDTYEYLDIFQNTELKVIEGAGHTAYIENREGYITNILNFINKS
ncbi:hypothetical protein PW52_07770 [Tamlana sedimentorum]|uniref:AB hydrolase-1 domain-containing protein n=2 Tax=Neotamlana sedimentorum TaxID=1435349 RepID=A0A0D7WD16_9FLAO|nr:hypothetical protein PW52_07770 [Tamlana sedimentorum]